MREPDPSQTRLVVLGAGGHAKVVLEILREGGADVIGLLDHDTTPRRVLGVEVIGDDGRLGELRDAGVCRAFVAVGDNRLRAELARKVQAAGYVLANAISPGAKVSASVQLGHGIAVMGGAVINAEAQLADLAILNTGAILDHDVSLGEAAHVGPGCALAGGVRVGARVFLGVGVSVIPRATIGDDTVVGAGACVVSDLPASVLAVGVPARVIRPLQLGKL